MHGRNSLASFETRATSALLRMRFEFVESLELCLCRVILYQTITNHA
jgi:hypothetical protein